MSENPLKIKVYDQPAEFVAKVGPHLEANRAMNNLMIGLAHRFAAVSPSGCLRQTAAWAGDTLAGAAMLSSPHAKAGNLIVATADSGARKLLAADTTAAVQAKGLVFTGVVGEEATAKGYAELFRQQGYKETGAMGQGIYRCRKVAMPPLDQPLTVRLATAADSAQVSRWFESYIEEALGGSGHGGDARVRAEGYIAAKALWLGERQLPTGPEPVTMAATSRATTHSASVHSVFTPNHERRQGFGSFITATVTQSLLSAGKEEIHLYTDLANPTANRIYQNIGFTFVGNSRHIYLAKTS